MLVNNHLPTVLDFGSYPNGTKLRDPGGKNDGVFIPGLQLKPGMNEVDPEAWAMWTTGRAASKGAGGKPAGLNWHVAVKNVEVVKVDVDEPDEDGNQTVKVAKAEDFADLKAKDAIALVKETFVVSMLEAWDEAEAEGEDRTTVKNAIDAQIELLEMKAKGTTDATDG